MALKDLTKELKQSLKQRFVFLSASLPREDRDWKYFKTAHPREITDAVSIFTKTVLISDGRLVFGGHPTISPLILQVAQEVGIKKLIKIYQSAYFQSEFTPEAYRLRDQGWAEFITTDVKPDPSNPDRDQSLLFMRISMLKHTDPICAVFIGGMEGIEGEFKLFKERCPDRPAYPLGSPGGASLSLLDEHRAEEFNTALDIKVLKESKLFPYLAQRIVAELEAKYCR